MRWVIDGNNVFGSRPDGWWNDRPGAQRRFTQRVAEWCRTHDDDVTLVFDAPVGRDTALLAGGNLTVVEASRRGRNGADDEIVDLVRSFGDPDADVEAGFGVDERRGEIRVVTSDVGLRDRLPDHVEIVGVGRFRDLVGY